MHCCTSCSSRRFHTLHAYLMHLRIRHAGDVNFRVICGIDKCEAEYHNYASLYKHIQRRHNDLLISVQPHNLSSDICCATELSDNDSEVESNCEVEECHDMYNSLEEFFSQLGSSVFKYSLKLREKHLLPASTHADIIADSKSLTSCILSCHNHLINGHLKSLGLNVDADKVLQDILDTAKYEQLWSECDSNYKLIKNCTNKLGLIKPVEQTIGTFKSYYIPLTDVLKMLVCKEDIAPYVTHQHVADAMLLTSYTCGDAFKRLALSNLDGHLLLVHLYNDEFEVVNPIGAKPVSYTHLTLPTNREV